MPMTMYGVSAPAASRPCQAAIACGLIACNCCGEYSIPERMKVRPMNTPAIEPRGLNDCAKLRRRSESSGGPKVATIGLADVSRKARPLAMTKSAARKKP
jgi:hypothetical protein